MAGNVASGRSLAQHVIRGFDPQHCQNRSLESKFLDVTESQILPALPKQISQPSQAPLLFFLFVLYQYIFCTIDTTSQLWKSDSALLHGWNISKRPHTEMPTQARRGKKKTILRAGRKELWAPGLRATARTTWLLPLGVGQGLCAVESVQSTNL